MEHNKLQENQLGPYFKNHTQRGNLIVGWQLRWHCRSTIVKIVGFAICIFLNTYTYTTDVLLFPVDMSFWDRLSTHFIG